MTQAAPANAPLVEESVRRPSRFRLSAWTVTGLAVLLGVVDTFPLVTHLTTAIYGTPGDSTGTIATFWWWKYAIQHHQSIFDNTFLGAPFGAGWGQVPFAVIPVAIFAPLSVLAGPTAAYNLGMLSSFPLTALAMYLLSRQLKLSPLASTFAALAFTFLPYHLEKAMGHTFQAHMELLPLLLLFLTQWWQGGSRWRLAAAGAVLGLEVWIDYQFALIMVFLAVVFFLVSLFVTAPSSTSRFPRRLGNHLLGGLVTAAAVLPFLPFAAILAHRPGSGGSYQQAVTGDVNLLRRSLSDIDIYSVRPWEYIVPWHANPLVPEWLRNFELANMHGSNVTEQAQFLGYTTIALAIVGVIAFRSRFGVALGLAVAAAGVVLALPAHVRPFGLHLIGPAYLLNHVIPFIRVYARFGILVMLGVTLLAGLGFATLETALSRPGRRALLIVPFALLAVEFNNHPPSHLTTLFPAPAEYGWLAGQPAGILVEYPLQSGNPQRQEIQTRQYTLYQQVHEHPMFNGSIPNSRADAMSPSLEPYYGPGVAARLGSLGVRYVFVHRADYLQDGLDVPFQVDGLRHLTTIADTEVFTVTGGTAP